MDLTQEHQNSNENKTDEQEAYVENMTEIIKDNLD